MCRRSFPLLVIAILVGISLAGCGALQGGQLGKGGQSGDVLYQADSSSGFEGWSGVGDGRPLEVN
jgi:hypothetical protein